MMIFEWRSPNHQRHARSFVYDSTADGCMAAEFIGLSPVSKEVARSEHKESDKRQLDLASHFSDEILFYSHVQAKAMSEFANQRGGDLDDEDYLYHVLHECALGAMLGILSTLVSEEKIVFSEAK